MPAEVSFHSTNLLYQLALVALLSILGVASFAFDHWMKDVMIGTGSPYHAVELSLVRNSDGEFLSMISRIQVLLSLAGFFIALVATLAATSVGTLPATSAATTSSVLFGTDPLLTGMFNLRVTLTNLLSNKWYANYNVNHLIVIP